MQHWPEAPDPNAALKALAKHSLPLTPWQGQEIAQGLWLHCDPLAKMQLHYASPQGRVLEIKLETIEQAGAWLGLHIALPHLKVTELTWFGFALRGMAEPLLPLRVCLRSDDGAGGFIDRFFERDIVLLRPRGDHFELFCPFEDPRQHEAAGWHELVLFLPCQHPFDLVIERLAVVAL